MGDGNGEMGMKGREWGGGNEGTGIGRWNRETGISLYIRIIFSSPQSTQTPLIFFAKNFLICLFVLVWTRCEAGWKGAKDHKLKGATGKPGREIILS